MNIPTKITALLHKLDTYSQPACAVLLIWFGAMVFFEIHQTPFYYDSAIHIDAAKHLAYGLGNGINAFTYELFSTLTTGPTVVWTGALATRLLGSQTSTSGIAAACLNVLLLVWIGRLASAQFRAQALPFLLILCAVFMLVDILWWSLFIGELASVLLFLIATLYATDHRLSERQRHVMVAVAATLSLRARLMSLPLIAGVGLYLLARQCWLIHQGQSSLRACASLFMRSVAVFAVISLIFESVEASFFLGDTGFSYLAFLSSRSDFLSGNSTLGIGNLLVSANPVQLILDNIITNNRFLTDVMARDFGISQPALWISAAYVLSLTTFARSAHALDRFLLVILLATSLMGIWFFALARITFDRYTMMFSFLALLMLWLALYRHLAWTGLLAMLLVWVIVLPQPARLRIADTLVFHTKDTGKAQLANYNPDIQAAADFLLTIKDSESSLVKCGWMTSTWSIDYLLPPGENFKDCYVMIRESISTTGSGSTLTYQWQKPVHFILAIDKTIWSFSKNNKGTRQVQKSIQNACKPHILFENNLIKVMQCTAENMQQHISPEVFARFVDETPYWKR